jgi:DNA replication protein DnaC
MITDPLTKSLNRLRLHGLLNTLDVRLEQAEKESLTASDFLQLVLQDEISRRDAETLIKRLRAAKFESQYTFDNLLLDNYPSQIKRNIRDLQTGNYLHEHKSIIIMGPTGTGKTHLAHALGHAACCKGTSTLFIRANTMLRQLQTSRADLSWSKEFHKHLKPKLLILDDFALKAMTPEQAEDVYELIAERHSRSSFIITSNRTVDAWVKLFPDPVMANAALDRLGNNSYQIILEGESFRKKNRPPQ